MAELESETDTRRRRANLLIQKCVFRTGKKRNISKLAEMADSNRTTIGDALRGAKKSILFAHEDEIRKLCKGINIYFQLAEIVGNSSIEKEMLEFIIKGYETPPGNFSEGRVFTMLKSASKKFELFPWHCVEADIETDGVKVSIPVGPLKAVDLATSFFPPQLVDDNFPFDYFYFENAWTGEEQSRIVLEIANLPQRKVDPKIKDKIEVALKSDDFTANERSQFLRFKRVLEQGSDTYLRLSSVYTESSPSRPNNLLRLCAVPALFNQGFYQEIATLLKRIGLFVEGADEGLQPCNVAVRAGVVRQTQTQKFVVFQRRSDANYLSPFWVDVGAVGYIKYEPDVSASDAETTRVSIVREAREEIAKELQIDDQFIPHYEGFAFFGLTRMKNGSLDIICQCSIKMHGAFQRLFVPAEKTVACKDDVLLEPKAIAEFILSDACKGQSGKATIVPSAIVTLICMLRRAGFSMEVINSEFKRLYGQIETDDKVKGRAGLL